jgi:imidazole glycerol-phosphate synthase subunit HisH
MLTVIVDYGMGNLASIENMLKKVGAAAVVSSDPKTIESADKLILPGVGAFDTAVARLESRGLRPVLDEQVVGRGKPVLGLCLGMQLLGRRSEEGAQAGLGWIDAETVRFRVAPGERQWKVPHMGWNSVRAIAPHPLLSDMPAEPRFYFVHSYHMVCADERLVVGTTHHAYEFASIVARANVLGVQFHPEKSHAFGMRLMRNFVERV